MHLLTNGLPGAKDVLVLAHGAGGAMDSPYMNRVADGVAECGIRVVRFEFPYMAARRSCGKRGAPDREPVLLDSWRQVVSELGGGPSVAIGGKSMGGRMASLIADEIHVRALICLGYPFHPPGQPEKLRTKHLAGLQTPTLIIQGERDRSARLRKCRGTTSRRRFASSGSRTAITRSSRGSVPEPRKKAISAVLSS